ncbi:MULTISPECIES: hypothetical protein [Massilia]|uniref:hypothetical protein n=1 Tax=Massilia TaxID=149698 RepID=UPI002554456B|nr:MULTISPECIES: hypothetical protein [Massilia]MDK6078058.1 hypothetical protein [Massilia varians]
MSKAHGRQALRYRLNTGRDHAVRKDGKGQPAIFLLCSLKKTHAGDRGNNSLQQRLDYIQVELNAITKIALALDTGAF